MWVHLMSTDVQQLWVEAGYSEMNGVCVVNQDWNSSINGPKLEPFLLGKGKYE